MQTETDPVDPGYGPYQNPISDYSDSTQGAEGYDAGKGSTKPAPAKAPPNKPPNGELTILTSYTWDPPISGKAELDYLLKGQWSPSFADFVEITGPSTVGSPDDFTALLGIINQFDAGSIKRLNFWTHSNKNTVGIRGNNIPGNVIFLTLVDDRIINEHLVNNYSYTFGKQQATFTLADVQSKFASDGLFVLYGCDVGFDPTTLLTGFRDLFKVTVIGFKEKMVYCPPTQTGTEFDRKGEKVGIFQKGFNCSTDSTRDWRSLISHVNAVTVKK